MSQSTSELETQRNTVLAEMAAQRAKLIEELITRFGPKVTQVLNAMDTIDALVLELHDEHQDAGEEAVEASIGLLRMLLDEFAQRAGFYGGLVAVSFSVAPHMVYQALQSGVHRGLIDAIKSHRDECSGSEEGRESTRPLEQLLVEVTRVDRKNRRTKKAGATPYLSFKH